MQHLRPGGGSGVERGLRLFSQLKSETFPSSGTASCVVVVLPPRFLSFRCTLSTNRLLGTLLKRFRRSESSRLHFYGASRQTWDQFKSVYTVELILWLQLERRESTLFRINDMVWLIERVLLCRWVRGGSKPAPTFSKVPVHPLQALLGATPGSLAPAFWALGQGGVSVVGIPKRWVVPGGTSTLISLESQSGRRDTRVHKHSTSADNESL